MPWSEEKKAFVDQAVGSSQYTSSDESDFSNDENGQPKLSWCLVKKLPREGSALTKVKKALDDAHSKSLNVRARVNMVARRLHPMPSTKPRTVDGLAWAVRFEEPATATSSTFSPRTPARSSRSTPSSAKRTSFHGIRPPTPATPSDSARSSTAGSSSRSIHPQTPTTPHSNQLLVTRRSYHSTLPSATGSSSDSSARRKKVPKSKKDTVRRPLKRVVTSPEY